jgi:hypothetical protein
MRSSALKIVPFVAAAFAIAAIICGDAGADVYPVDDVVWDAPESQSVISVALSPDCHHVAMVLRRQPSGNDLWLNGSVAASARAIPAVAYSPDSRHLAYVVDDGSAMSVVLDGRKGASYDEVATGGEHPLVFCAESDHLAYAARRGAKWFVVEDVAEHDAGSQVPRDLQLARDGASLAFVAKENDLYRLIFNGVAQAAFADIRDVRLSSDGHHVGYAASQAADQWVAVFDGRKSNPYLFVTGICLGPHGEHPTFAGQLSRQDDVADSVAVVTDGVQGSAIYSLTAGPTMSPDGKQIIYCGLKAVGQPEKSPLMASPSFRNASLLFEASGDLPSLAFAIAHDGHGINMAGPLLRDAFVGGTERAVIFTADSLHWAAATDGNEELVRDGQRIEDSFSEIGCLAISP